MTISNSLVPKYTYSLNSPIASSSTSSPIAYTFNSNSSISSTVNISGDMQVSGNIILNNSSLNYRLEYIESRLHIPARSIELEKTHEGLAKIWEEYVNTTTELERLCNEYNETLNAIKTFDIIRNT